MTGCWMNFFIFLLLVWKVGALDKEHDWTFGKPALNIAYSKSSSDSNAVDGDFETIAQLTENPPQGWTVDLGAKYTVAMLRMYPKAPEGSFHDKSTTNHITIWTSTAETPGGIFNSSDWKNVTYAHTVYGYGVTADYQPPAQIRHLGVTTTENNLRISEFQVFEAKILTTKEDSTGTLSQSENGWTPNSHTNVGPDREMVFEFSTSILEVQRVALVSYKSSPLTVAEVVVYEYNYALGKLVTAEPFVSFASQVVDGHLSIFLEMPRNVNATLNLDFGKMIIFRKALIYVTTGYCKDQYCSREFYSKKIYAITSGEDELCLHVANSIGDSFVLECDKTVFRGLKIVSSLSTTELREIVVYGKESPTMDDTEFEVKRVDNTRVTLTFTQWNSSKPGSRPPDKYILRNEGNGTRDETEFDHKGGGPIQTTIRGIQRNDWISVYVECEIDGEKCAGLLAEAQYLSQSDGQIVEYFASVEICQAREAVIEGSQARFQCVASCLPHVIDCTVRWGFKTQFNPLPAGVSVLNSSVIHFSPATPGHSGRYYCWVEGFRRFPVFGELTVYSILDGCQDNEYTCENRRCVSGDHLCNGSHDCADNSDKRTNSSPIPIASVRPITSVRPTTSAPTTGKVQNTTGIIVGVTLAVMFLVLVGIGAAIFMKKRQTTAVTRVGNINKPNKMSPMVREKMTKFTKPKEAVPVSKLPDIRVGLRHA